MNAIRFRQYALAMTISAVISCPVGVVRAQTIEDLKTAKSIEERMQLRCPPAGAPGDFSKPVRQYPSADISLWTDFSGGNDVARIAGFESEGQFFLGAGDDIALIYDAEGDTQVSGNQGADTVLLCSVADLYATIDVNDYGMDPSPDVVIVEAAVFSNVPDGMVRGIRITVDPDVDRVVIRHPADAPVNLNIQDDFTSGTIGSVEISFPMPGPGAVPILVPERAALEAPESASVTNIVPPAADAPEEVATQLSQANTETSTPVPYAGVDAGALAAEWRRRGCRMTEDEILDFILSNGGAIGDFQAHLTDLLRSGVARGQPGTDDLVLHGVAGCPAVDAAPYNDARWTVRADQYRMGIAEVATMDGTFRLDCGNAGLFVLQLMVPGVTDGAATASLAVDGREMAGIDVRCDAESALCEGTRPIEDPRFAEALRSGGSVEISGLADETVRFPLRGSSRAIGSLGCSD